MYFFCEDKPNLIKNKLRNEQWCYLDIMNKKKTTNNSKKTAFSQMKNIEEAKIPKDKNKDFGGIPDIDPKKFLGCG